MSPPPPPSSSSTTTTFTPPPLPYPLNLSLTPPKLITQGAEALLYYTHFLLPSPVPSPASTSTSTSTTHPKIEEVEADGYSIPAALKHRPPKPYRHPTLDRRLTRHRILAEARVLVKLRGLGVGVPGLLALDVGGGEGGKLGRGVGGEGEGGEGREGGWMMMEWIEGGSVRDCLRGAAAAAAQGGKKERRGEREGGQGDGDGRGEKEVGGEEVVGGGGEEVGEGVGEEVKGLLGRIGQVVGGLHRAGVVHGDLTTSNMMVRSLPSLIPPKRSGEEDGITENSGWERGLGGEIVLIDFGLAAQSVSDEDRAVDLYVLERAFGSTHPELEGGFGEVLKGYAEGFGAGGKGVLRKLEDVRGRGRKRSMLG